MKIILIGFVMLLGFTPLATMAASHVIQNKLIGCSGLPLENQLSCFNAIQKELNQAISIKLKDLPTKDKIHLLNTKALRLDLLKQGCEVDGLSDITIKTCKINADISLLNYIESRYEI